MMRTTAAVVERPGGEFTLTEVDLDEPREDEVLVRVVASGLCHTDVSLRDTLPAEMFPRIFGHEGAGVVEQVGSAVTHLSPGDHVVMSLASCRSCPRCTAGEVGYCDDTFVLNYLGTRMDGSTTCRREGGPVFASFLGQSSFARHALAHASSCVRVDPALDLTRVAPFGCGFQTGAGAVLNVLRPAPRDSVVVYGAGAVGLAAVAAAVSAGAEPVAVDLNRDRLAHAERLGAVTVDPAEWGGSTVERVKELTGGGAHGAVETTAVPAVLTEAVRALGARGTLVVLGLDMAHPEFSVDAVDLLQSGKVVRGSIEGDSDPQQMVPRLLDLVGTGRFAVDPLLTTYSFADLDTAIADVVSGRVVKPVLVW
ncbi:NAD(P)-dependent alcohol dehydrogenase [Nocardioides terrisoli]|uniref:NAD(P)-dependent alcohol dehydrogenase n=1 Tax=Nocardioides terrisoli TaxID=3388267 RepID=UPI00287B679F|nr:NAD(P)-dependent alcohol dehydrogenase [Nocardioides marmorisolisilvae]